MVQLLLEQTRQDICFIIWLPPFMLCIIYGFSTFNITDRQTRVSNEKNSLRALTMPHCVFSLARLLAPKWSQICMLCRIYVPCPNDKKSTKANPKPRPPPELWSAKELYSFDLWSFHSFDHTTPCQSQDTEGAKAAQHISDGRFHLSYT